MVKLPISFPLNHRCAYGNWSLYTNSYPSLFSTSNMHQSVWYYIVPIFVNDMLKLYIYISLFEVLAVLLLLTFSLIRILYNTDSICAFADWLVSHCKCTFTDWLYIVRYCHLVGGFNPSHIYPCHLNQSSQSYGWRTINVWPPQPVIVISDLGVFRGSSSHRGCFSTKSWSSIT